MLTDKLPEITEIRIFGLTRFGKDYFRCFTKLQFRNFNGIVLKVLSLLDFKLNLNKTIVPKTLM